LRALNDHDFATIPQLGMLTGLPRATMYRLLETLTEAGYVARSNGTDRYCLTSAVRGPSSGFDDRSLAAEVARPLVEEFSASIGWPSYLFVFDDDAMLIRQMVYSPRACTGPRVGDRVPVIHSAPGRALLAVLPEEKREPIVARVQSKEGLSREKANWTSTVARVQSKEGLSREKANWTSVDNLVKEVRQRGCGFRVEGILPRTCSIALPVTVRNNPAAFVSAAFFRSVVPLDKAIRNYLPPLRELVSQIETGVSAALASTAR
jgi:IclR family mhp operon transcriptional activator